MHVKDGHDKALDNQSDGLVDLGSQKGFLKFEVVPPSAVFWVAVVSGGPKKHAYHINYL